MKRYISVLIFMSAMAALGGCAVTADIQTSKPSLDSHLVYGIVRSTENCGLLSPKSILAFKYKGLAGAYRIVELKLYATGTGFFDATADGMSVMAYVPDGVPELKAGDGVLFRKGDTPYFSGFDPSHPGPDSGINNVVVADLGYVMSTIVMPRWNRPTVGWNQSPWLRMPWKDSVEHYDLHFTPFYKVNEKAGTCAQLRPYPNPGNPMYIGYPKWPARVDGK
jgi:hypothetical protein